VIDHLHQGFSMHALPGSSLAVFVTHFLFRLLIRLLANLSRFHDRRQPAQLRLGWQLGEIILRFSADAALADQPNLFSGKMLLSLVADPLWRSIRDTHPNGGETRFQCALGSLPPADGPPDDRRQNLFGWP